MDNRTELMNVLLEGLPSDECADVVAAMRRTAAAELYRTQNPPPRRVRNADGELVDRADWDSASAPAEPHE